ncbi:TIGR03086 family metal-binding protein [Streptacidiphilus sp. PAMC 29251]
MTETATTPETAAADPRVNFAKAVSLAGETLAGVRPEHFDLTTPCPEYSVRLLSNHLVAVLRRVAAIGRGADPFSLPGIAEDVADGDWAKAWTETAHDVEAVWSDSSLLGRPLQLPMGTLPGAVAMVIYSTEFTVHTWDLATATGQKPAWDQGVLAVSTGSMRHAVPAGIRGGPAPFGPVVEVPADAPAIDQLVGWYGRRP